MNNEHYIKIRSNSIQLLGPAECDITARVVFCYCVTRTGDM